MFTMGLPTLAAQLINLIYNIVDRIYIGHMPNVGENALTGVGLCIPIIIIISAFSSLIGGGGPPRAAIALGQNDREKADRILSGGVTVLIILALILSVTAYFIKKPFLYFIGASDATYIYAESYLNIYLLGTVFVQITVGLNQFITAQGKSTLAMLSVLIGAILNIILDPIFIYGLKMGVGGAALATIISQFFSALWVIRILSSKKASIRIKREFLKPNFKVLSPVLALGFSPFIMQSTESLISIVMSKGLSQYGGDVYVGSLVIFQSVMQIISVPVSAFAQGVTPIMSYNFGAGKNDRVMGVYKRMTLVLVGYSTLCSAFAIIFPGVFVSIFADGKALYDIGVKYLPIFVAGMLVFGFQMCSQNTFVALGQAKLSIIFALLRKVILLIPLALILPRFFGVDGIYYSEPISDVISAVCCLTTFLFTINGILKRGPSPRKSI